MVQSNGLIPSTPLDGYELVSDAPKLGDMACHKELWWEIKKSRVGMLYIGDYDTVWLPAGDLRWIARKKS